MANDNKLVNLADLKEAFDDVKESIPSKTSQLTNDSGYITGYTETDPTVPSWAKASSKPSYSASEVGAKSTQSAVNSPTASGTALAFIDTISQNAQGVITPTKKTVAGASQSAAGLMSAGDKKKLDGIASGATANTGTVTSIATGVGLTGGTITGSGTVKAKLKTETALTNDSAAATETSGRVYPVAVDKSGYLAVNVPWTDSKPVTSVAGKTGAVTLAKGDVGLGNVDNKSSATIRGEITSSNVTTALGYTPLNASLKGASNGIAELDTNGKVPSSQLPSYVDDVLEYAKTSSFPATGETGKIYIAQDTNKTYRWSGTAYVEISASLALGTTSSTAYRGDYGNAAYTHAVTNKGSAFSSGLYKITTNSEGHVTAATAVSKSDITGLGIPGSDTNTTYSLTQDSSDGHKITLTPSSGTAQTITIPDNNTWRPVSDSVSSTSSSDAASSKAVKTAYDLAASKTANTGTVTSVATGVGLTGGTITGSGTLKVKLRSETALTIDSAAATTTSGRVYPVAVDKTGYLAVNVPWTDNNTIYSAGTGLSLSGTTFSNSGVTGVKGNAESSYRTGNVNLTPANIGAAPIPTSSNLPDTGSSDLNNSPTGWSVSNEVTDTTARANAHMPFQAFCDIYTVDSAWKVQMAFPWYNTDGFAIRRRAGNGTWTKWAYNGINSTTVTGTPDINGDLNLRLSEYDYVVVSAKAPNLIVTPWVYDDAHIWFARITDVNGSAVTSGSVTVTVYYRKIS